MISIFMTVCLFMVLSHTSDAHPRLRISANNTVFDVMEAPPF